MKTGLLSIKLCVHMIDNSNNEIRGSGIKRDAGGDEKQLIKLAWSYQCLTCDLTTAYFPMHICDCNIFLMPATNGYERNVTKCLLELCWRSLCVESCI